jgi:CHAD domain-containing protein
VHLDALVDELRRHVPPALQQFETDAVHKARVATRRLKAAVDLLSSCLDKDHARPFAKLGRKLRRQLGPLRDADVMIGHLDEIRKATKAASGAAWLRQRLVREREAARAGSAGKLSASDVLSRLGAWWALREDVIECHAAIPSLLGESLHLQLDRFNEQADRLINKTEGGDGSAAGDPHELRIAGKALRYTLELAQAQGHEMPKALLKTFKRMQDCLGTWHDWVVLAERAMQASIDENLPLHDASTQRQVLALIDFGITKAQRELDRFAKLWQEQGPQITRTVREAFPLTRPVVVTEPSSPTELSESQTDRGRADSPTPTVPSGDSTDPPPAV